MRELLRHRDFRLILAGQSLSMFGDWTLLLVFGIWGKSLTGSNAIAGLMIFAMAGPGLLGPLGGLLADRVRRRHLMVTLNVLSAGAVLLLWFVHDRDQLWLLFAVAAWYGLSGVVFDAAISGLVQALLPAPLIGPANGSLTTVRQGLRLIGPLVGAGLFTTVGGGWVATLDALTFLLSAALLLRLRLHEGRPERTATPFRTEVSAGLVHLVRAPLLRHLSVVTAICGAAFGLIEATVFAVVDTGLHEPPAFVGVVVSAEGVGALVGGVAVTIAIHRLPETALVITGQALAAIGIGVLITATLPTVLLGAALLGAALPIINVAALTLLQRTTPNPLMGRVTAAFDLANTVPYTVSIALGAVLATALPYQAVLGLVVTGCALAALYATLTLRVRTPRPARTEPPVAKRGGQPDSIRSSR